MIRTGLVSVTFRELSPQTLVAMVERAGLHGIEWGGDVHVPHGDLRRANDIGEITRDAGLVVTSYGSYYRLAHSEDEGLSFHEVLKTAQALQADLIRVWAGTLGSDQADPAHRVNIVRDARRIALMARQEGLRIAFEYHANSLTDTNESALQLIDEIGMDDVQLYWQPPIGSDFQQNCSELTALLPCLANLHIFAWQGVGEDRQRLPLSEHRDRWTAYLKLVMQTGREHDALLEFVPGDAPDQFARDAETLKQIVADL
jgi:hypothetical protein